MAIVKYSELYARVSGRVGTGNVVNSFIGGQPLVRQFTQPVNPDTSNQQQIRSYFSSATKGWSDLTGPQRSDWDAWAQTHPVFNRFGVQVSRTGLSAWTQIAVNVMIRTGSLPDGDIPTIAQPSIPTLISLTAAGPGNEMAFVLNHTMASLTNIFLYTSATPAMATAGQNPRLPEFRLVQGVDSTSVKALEDSGDEYIFNATRYSYANGNVVGVMCWLVTSEGYAGKPLRVTDTYHV